VACGYSEMYPTCAVGRKHVLVQLVPGIHKQQISHMHRVGHNHMAITIWISHMHRVGHNHMAITIWIPHMHRVGHNHMAITIARGWP
jgi:hypothetical protein